MKDTARVLGRMFDAIEFRGSGQSAVEDLAKGDKKVGKSAVEIDTELFVGGRRVFEREQARERLKQLGYIAGSKIERTRPGFLFATSAGEVGVDLDADHMVCDLVAWERMVQRLGRVNRRGRGRARIEIVAAPPKKGAEKWEDRLARLRAPLDALAEHEEGGRDASPAAIVALKQRAESDPDLRSKLEDATTPEPLRPALTRPLVEAWSMTSTVSGSALAGSTVRAAVMVCAFCGGLVFDTLRGGAARTFRRARRAAGR